MIGTIVIVLQLIVSTASFHLRNFMVTKSSCSHFSLMAVTDLGIEQDIQSHKAPIHEISRRRNFAIISHPDAGKTTLTEKLLLFGGAIQDAGAVKARADQRKATSDW